MRLIDVGPEAEGVIAIGQGATGVIAIGQLASGVVAIGQLARGVIVVGQLAVGVFAFGQAVLALAHGGGMVGLAGIRIRQSLLVLGVAGRADPLSPGRSWAERARVEWARTPRAVTAVRTLMGVGLTVAVFLVGLRWLGDLPGRLEPPAPPPPTYAPGTR